MDFDARIENQSLAAAAAMPMLDREGRDVLVVAASIGYRVGLNGEIDYDPRSVDFSDEPDDGGGIRRPGCLADEKPGTDVALVGTAHARPGAPAPRSLAWFSVGPLRSVVQLIGPRTYQLRRGTVEPSTPAPLTSIPLRWDHAFGGLDVTDRDKPSAVANNPLGRGFARDPRSMVGLPAPEILASEGQDEQTPAGFAPVPASWEPRRSRFGTYDEAWARDRAPVGPRDADPRRYSWAAPGLWSSVPLSPGAPIEVGGVLRETAAWRFTLPSYAVKFAWSIDGTRHQSTTHLDGIVVDADERRADLIWRVAIRLPRKWQRLESIEVIGVGTLDARVMGDSSEPNRTDSRAGGLRADRDHPAA